jgi:hypothetical protein
MIETFIQQLRQNPETIQFTQTITLIDSSYNFTPTSFRNGELKNDAGQNSGSCKLLAFAKKHQLTTEETLHCFGDYYRIDVLGNPDGTDHQNIRNFIRLGWDEVEFDQDPLTPL